MPLPSSSDSVASITFASFGALVTGASLGTAGGVSAFADGGVSRGGGAVPLALLGGISRGGGGVPPPRGGGGVPPPDGVCRGGGGVLPPDRPNSDFKPIPIMVNMALMIRKIQENKENMPPHIRMKSEEPDFSTFSCIA